MSALGAGEFYAYLDAFNRNQYSDFGRFYAYNVEFVGRAAQCRGRNEVLSFYKMVKSRIRETLTLHALVIGENAIAADIETELYPLDDWPDFPTGALKRGEPRRSQNFIWYDVADGKFTRIRAAHYRRLFPGDEAPDTVAKPDLGMTPDRFATYIAAFNRDDYATFGSYYHEDVMLTLAGKRDLRGRDAIFDFYRDVKAKTHRTIQVNNVVASGNQLAAELQSEFRALEDLPTFTAGPMKKGDRIFINTVVLYELRDGKFARIRSAELKKIIR